MRKVVLDMVYELAKKDKRIFFIGSDLGAGTLDNFKQEMPDRFFMEGVSEQNIVGMAAGLALQGKVVYVNTIATFITRRCFEQNVLDLAISFLKLSILFNRMGIDTHDVLEAAGTKWNFLPFEPGLVGGHCIGVDPYYLTYKAESIGYHPKIILAGREFNDNMGNYVA